MHLLSSKNTLSLFCACVFYFLTNQTIAEDLPDRAPTGIYVGFVPGDAFVWIAGGSAGREKFVESHKLHDLADGAESSRLVFNNMIPHIEPRVSGPYGYFVGYLNTEVTGNLKRCSDILIETIGFASRESLTRREEQGLNSSKVVEDPFIALIVNRDFDFESHHLMLRYNEDWKKLETDKYPQLKGTPFGKIGRKTYQPYVWTPEAIIEDWRHCDLVAPLAAKLPPPTDKVLTPSSNFPGSSKVPPIQVNFDDIAFVCVPGDDVDVAFNHPLNTPYFVGNNQGVFKYSWELNKRNRKVLTKEQYLQFNADGTLVESE